MITADIEGLEELKRKMRDLGPKIARTALRSAVNSGAQVIKKQAKSLAPIDTGKLSKRAIYVQRSRRESPFGKETYKVAVRLGRKEQERSRDAYYWWWIEFGTGPRYQKKTGKYIGSVPAKPFMRPAYESKKFEALEKIKQKLAERLEKLVQMP